MSSNHHNNRYEDEEELPPLGNLDSPSHPENPQIDVQKMKVHAGVLNNGIWGGIVCVLVGAALLYFDKGISSKGTMSASAGDNSWRASIAGNVPFVLIGIGVLVLLVSVWRNKVSFKTSDSAKNEDDSSNSEE